MIEDQFAIDLSTSNLCEDHTPIDSTTTGKNEQPFEDTPAKCFSSFSDSPASAAAPD